MSSYRKEFSFEQRKNDSISILKKYPDKMKHKLPNVDKKDIKPIFFNKTQFAIYPMNK